MDTISNASLQHMILDSLFISYCSVFFAIVNFARLMISYQTFRGGFHEIHRNLRLILGLTMCHSLYGFCDGFRQFRWVIHHRSRYD
jgi:hypothetical protein